MQSILQDTSTIQALQSHHPLANFWRFPIHSSLLANTSAESEDSADHLENLVDHDEPEWNCPDQVQIVEHQHTADLQNSQINS